MVLSLSAGYKKPNNLSRGGADRRWCTRTLTRLNWQNAITSLGNHSGASLFALLRPQAVVSLVSVYLPFPDLLPHVQLCPIFVKNMKS